MHKPKMTVGFLQRIVMPEWVALGIYYFDPLHPIFRSRRANEFMEKEEAMRQITSNETSARYNIHLLIFPCFFYCPKLDVIFFSS